MNEPDAARRVVTDFYACFAAREGDGMAARYAAHATFSDPAFPALHGAEIGAMWRMLVNRSPALQVTLEELRAADGETGELIARWTARYPFSPTGRQVINHVTSTIAVDGDLIVRQRDDFDFLAWQAQALGGVGRLLGWTGLPGLLVRGAARRGLADFIARHESTRRA